MKFLGWLVALIAFVLGSAPVWGLAFVDQPFDLVVVAVCGGFGNWLAILYFRLVCDRVYNDAIEHASEMLSGAAKGNFCERSFVVRKCAQAVMELKR